MKQDVPVNEGVKEDDYSKEHPWAGTADRNYGEFYKKMNLNQKRVPREAALFYNFWSIYKKLVFAICIVFFKNFRVQAYSQVAASAVMTGYVFNYWPCARFVDNVSKIVNELCFIVMLVSCAYIKEVGQSVTKFDPANKPPAFTAVGGFMFVTIVANMTYHGVRLVHNSIQAAKTIRMRRQQIASKWLGPPDVNDPDYSTDSDSGGEDSQPSIKPELDINLILLKVPPVPAVNLRLFNEIKDRSLFPRPLTDNFELPRLPL